MPNVKDVDPLAAITNPGKIILSKFFIVKHVFLFEFF
jgi:hypothetical protein